MTDLPKLFVRPIEAFLNATKDWHKTTDLFVVGKLGSQIQKTSVHRGGGNRASWGECLVFSAGPTDAWLLIEIVDRDSLPWEPHVGTCTVSLSDIFLAQHVDRWFDLYHRNKPAGKIRIILESALIADQNRYHPRIQNNAHNLSGAHTKSQGLLFSPIKSSENLPSPNRWNASFAHLPSGEPAKNGYFSPENAAPSQFSNSNSHVNPLRRSLFQDSTYPSWSQNQPPTFQSSLSTTSTSSPDVLRSSLPVFSDNRAFLRPDDGFREYFLLNDLQN